MTPPPSEPPSGPPAFSVVVATYGRPALLAQALASVQEQTCGDLECIVVDDGSATARDAMPDDPRFRLIEVAENRGPAAARNVGIEHAGGAAVGFLDDDDVWTPHRLADAGAALARADVVVCGSRWMHRSASSELRALEGDVHDVILDRFTPNLGQTLVRRSVLVPLDPTYAACQDIEWWLRQSAGVRVTTVSSVGLLSRRHGGERSLNGIEARIAGSERLLRDHADYFSTHPRARAFREYRIGVMASKAGRPEARRWLLRSLRSRPSLRTVRVLLGRPR